MKKQFFRLSTLLIVAISLNGCGAFDGVNTEKSQPLYSENKNEHGETVISVQVTNPIEQTVIKTGFIRRFLRTIIGWIPLAGELIELPMDLINALIPVLPVNEILNLPKNAKIDDPGVVAAIDSVQLLGIHLSVTPKKKRKNYKPKRCIIKSFCKDQNLKFIEEVAIVIEEKTSPENTILIAKGTRDKNMTDDGQLLILVPVPDLNLKDFLYNVERYNVRSIIRGRPPKRDLYLEGQIHLNVKFKF